MGDSISRQAAIETLDRFNVCGYVEEPWEKLRDALQELPAAQPERLTDDDFETIRIHLNAYKEKLCNKQRWKEAEEYQRIIDRFMAFASTQPEITRCKDCKHWGSRGLCEIWNEYISNDDFYCGCAERRVDEQSD